MSKTSTTALVVPITRKTPASATLPMLELDVYCQPEELTPYARRALRSLTLEDVMLFHDSACSGLEYLGFLAEQFPAAAALGLVEALGGGTNAKNAMCSQIAWAVGVKLHAMLESVPEDASKLRRFSALPREKHSVVVTSCGDVVGSFDFS